MRLPLALLRRSALALSICLGAGLAFSHLGTALPWLLGPLSAMTLASLLGLPVSKPPAGLPLGQIIIGTALGQYFTAPVMQELLHHLLPIFVGAVFALALGILSGRMLRRLAGCDTRTAFFASLPAGAAEMAVLAERSGGRADLVAAAQASRLILVVLIVPPLLTWSGTRGADLWQPAVQIVYYPLLLLSLALSLAAAILLHRLRMPNSWIIGPLLITLVVTSSNTQLSAIPAWAVNAAQLLIGCALGSRFRSDFLRAAPRFMASVLIVTCGAIAMAGIVAGGLAALSGLKFGTSVLALAPGGIAEMSVTAKALQLGVPTVVAFHVTRMATLLLTAEPIFRLQERFTPRVNRLLDNHVSNDDI